MEHVLLLSDNSLFLFGDNDKNGIFSKQQIGESTFDLSDSLCKSDSPNDIAMKNILHIAASAERGSEHPLSKGITKRASELGINEDSNYPLLNVENFVAEVGIGIKCTVNGKSVLIGNRKSLEVNQINTRPGTFDAMDYLESRGETAVTVCIDGKTEAVIGLIDKARDDASVVVSVLTGMGIGVYMLTGDNVNTARFVAQDIGLHRSNVIADVLPEGKVDCIKDLQHKGHCVAMIGDG